MKKLNTFKYHVGDSLDFLEDKIDGRLIERIQWNGTVGPEPLDETGTPWVNAYHPFSLRHCNKKERAKAGLVNIVLENYKRKMEGLNLIPVIFFIGSNTSNLELNSESVCKRYDLFDEFTTNKELRRCFRLIQKEELLKSPDLKHIEDLETLADELTEIAKQTFYSVKMNARVLGEGNPKVRIKDADRSMKFILSFEEQSLVWEHKDWGHFWTKRKTEKQEALSGVDTTNRLLKPFPWRKELFEKAQIARKGLTASVKDISKSM